MLTGPRTSCAIMAAISARPPMISCARSVARRARMASERCGARNAKSARTHTRRPRPRRPGSRSGGRRRGGRASRSGPPVASIQAAASHGCGERTSPPTLIWRTAAIADQRRSPCRPRSQSSGRRLGERGRRCAGPRSSRAAASGGTRSGCTSRTSRARRGRPEDERRADAACGRVDPTRGARGRSRRRRPATRRTIRATGATGPPTAEAESDRIQCWSNTIVCTATVSSAAPTNSGCVLRVLRYRVKPTAAPLSPKPTSSASFAARPSGDQWGWTPIVARTATRHDGDDPPGRRPPRVPRSLGMG